MHSFARKKHLQCPCSVELFFKWATFALRPQTQNYSNQKWNNLKFQEVVSACLLKSFILYFKRPLSSFENPRFQNETLNLVLKRRPGGTQKRSINILKNPPWVKILENILLLWMFMEGTINLFNHLFVFWRAIIITFKRSYTVVIYLLSLKWIVS